MSIKILLISSDAELFQKFENAYQSHIEKGFFKIYSPKNIENTPNKTIYDVLISEEQYVSLIPIKSIPIIIISNNPGLHGDDYLYISTPIDWQNLYDTILGLQYHHKNNNLSVVEAPNIEILTTTLVPSQMEVNLPTIKKTDNLEFKVNKIEPYSIQNLDTVLHTSYENIINETPSSNLLTANNEETNNYEIPINNNYLHQLTTKLYDTQDAEKVNKILSHYGEENKISDKIIAQASIILDELVHTINSISNNDASLMNQDPKVLMTVLHNDHEFKMNIECLTAINNDVKNILSIAQDYANTVQSFKRNNSYFFNLQWDI
jgi:hypothetical protein